MSNTMTNAMTSSISDVAITPEMTVNEVVQRYPAALPALAEIGIDSCCGGAHSLKTVAAKHGLDLSGLLNRLTRAAMQESV